jgi:hypothetical protein
LKTTLIFHSVFAIWQPHLPATLCTGVQCVELEKKIERIKTSVYAHLTHFLPSKLCTTYSYAQVKFEKNEWCRTKKNHKKIIHKPILILLGGNVV